MLEAACNKGSLLVTEWILRHWSAKIKSLLLRIIQKIMSRNNKITANDLTQFRKRTACINQALITACSNGHVKVIQLLVDETLFISEDVDRNGNTALHLVICNCSNDWTSLHAACDKNDADEIEKLLSAYKHPRGKKIRDKKFHIFLNKQNNYGRTPLHQACLVGHLGIVRILLSQFALTNIKNHWDETPYEQAIYNGNKHIQTFLEFYTMS